MCVNPVYVALQRNAAVSRAIESGLRKTIPNQLDLIVQPANGVGIVDDNWAIDHVVPGRNVDRAAIKARLSVLDRCIDTRRSISKAIDHNPKFSHIDPPVIVWRHNPLRTLLAGITLFASLTSLTLGSGYRFNAKKIDGISNDPR